MAEPVSVGAGSRCDLSGAGENEHEIDEVASSPRCGGGEFLEIAATHGLAEGERENERERVREWIGAHDGGRF